VLPAAIPETVMGLGYILAFNKPYFFIYGTFWIIIINIIYSITSEADLVLRSKAEGNRLMTLKRNSSTLKMR
jgi:ABC-type Fe3+ transport system permease subunit